MYCADDGHHEQPPQQPTANAVVDPITGNSLEYRHLIKGPNAAHWTQGNINEIGRLTDGRVGTSGKGTNTMFFRPHTALPAGRTATYLQVVSSYRPQKADPYRIRWTVGGNRIDYPGNITTPTADMTTAKLLINSTISTQDARFMGIDIKDFYLNMPMARSEYMWIPTDMLPPSVMEAYQLHSLVHKGRVLVEIQKGMYDLP